MIKAILTIVFLVTLMGCSKSYDNLEGDYILPPELQHCKVYRLNSGGGTNIKVVYCPDKETTSVSYRSGKSSGKNAVLIK